MAEHIQYQEWKWQNQATKFPFSDRATLTNGANRVLLEGTFLDAILYPIGGTSNLFLTQIIIDHETVELFIGNESNLTLCSGSCSLVNPEDTITLTDVYGRPAGLLISESLRLSVFQSWGVGTFTFKPEQSEFAAVVCVPTPEIGVRGIVLDDGSLFVGDVWMIGADGVVLRTEALQLPATCEEAAHFVRVIRIDVVGDPLFRRRLCEPQNLFETPRFIRTIRFVGDNMTFDCTPDQYGNLTITTNNVDAADTVLRITATSAGLYVGAVGEALQ